MEFEPSIIDIEKYPLWSFHQQHPNQWLKNICLWTIQKMKCSTFDSSDRFIEKFHDSSLEAFIWNIYLEGKVLIEVEISDVGPVTRSLRPCSMNEDSLAMYQNEETSPNRNPFLFNSRSPSIEHQAIWIFQRSRGLGELHGAATELPTSCYHLPSSISLCFEIYNNACLEYF